MKAWDILAYAADADFYCPKCAGSTYSFDYNVTDASVGIEDREGNELTPVFASGDDLNDNECCCVCFGVLND